MLTKTAWRRFAFAGYSVLAVFVGLAPQASFLAPLVPYFLQIIFFFTALTMDLSRLVDDAKDWKAQMVSNGLMLVAFPVLTFIVTKAIAPDLVFPLTLLAAMPTALSAPALIGLIDGDEAMALSVTVSTSLLAPFTIPLLFGIFFGMQAWGEAFVLFKNLAFIIVLPFVAALIVRRLFPRPAKAIGIGSKPFMTLLVLGIIAGAVAAKNSEIVESMLTLPWQIGYDLFALFIFFAFTHLVGYLVFWRRDNRSRYTLSAALTYMNFTLAMYIASIQQLPGRTVIVLALAAVPYAIMPSLWHAFIGERFGRR